MVEQNALDDLPDFQDVPNTEAEEVEEVEEAEEEWVLVGDGLDQLFEGEESEVLQRLHRVVGSMEVAFELGTEVQV